MMKQLEQPALPRIAENEIEERAERVRCRPKVGMILYNSVLHDARVLKEAASLQKNEFDVTIYGYTNEPAEDGVELVLPSQVRVMRYLPNVPNYRLILKRCLAAGKFSLTAAFGAVICLLITNFQSAMSWMASHPVYPALFVAVASGLIMFRLSAIRWTKEFGNSFLTWVCRKIDAPYRLHNWGSRIIEVLSEEHVDVVHCHDAHTLRIGGILRRRGQCQFVYDSHELPEHQFAFTWSRRRRIIRRQRKYGKLADAFITVNDYIADYFAKHHPYIPKATVIMNATLPQSAPIHYDGRLHEAAGLNRSDKIVLFQGGLAKGRGLHLLLEAAATFPDGWHLVFMGRGAYEAELRELRSHLHGAEEKVRFIPLAPHAELREWTAGASIGVIPYENTCLNHWFCSPNKLWEYPNAGVPVLASSFPVMDSMVGGNDIGWLLPTPTKSADIARVIGSVTDEELGCKRANCARFIARDNWSVYEARLLSLYENLSDCQNSQFTSKRAA